MAELLTYGKRKSTAHEIFDKIISPENIVPSPVPGFLSLNGFGKLGPLPLSDRVDITKTPQRFG
jgi:hypothetical protein